MSTKDAGRVKRFGGRWIRDGQQYRERNRVLKAVAVRFWYLLVPFLGVMWVHDSYVRPVEEDVKSVTNREKAEVMDHQDDIRAQVSSVQSETHEVESRLDSLYLQITFYGAIHDSLRQLRLVYDQNLPRSKSRVDSLTAIRDDLSAELAQLDETYRLRTESLRDRREWHATMDDSIRGLDSLIAMKTDALYRARNPLEYRRRDAILTGEGVYPNRDENPGREGGQ